MTKTILILAAALFMAGAAIAQPCQSDVPDSIIVGNSYCLQLCEFELYVITFFGDINGPGGVPVLRMRAGCTIPDTCFANCTPIEPPAELVFGGDPFAPFQWYGESPCMIIHEWWGHDNYWYIEIFSLCSGCFCLSFDRQLPVELRSFDAIAGDNEVTLSWATASENANDHFVIERDGATVTTVHAQGDDVNGHSYNWSDTDVENGRTYEYKLYSVSVSGVRQLLGTDAATPTHSSRGTVTEYALHQNYPNPFNPSTSISYDLPASDFVTLKVYNPMGAEVMTLVNGYRPSGRHSVEFDATKLTSGLYFYSIKIGDKYSATRKMLLVK